MLHCLTMEFTDNPALVEKADSKGRSLETLPHEILLMIISYLPSEKLIALYSLSDFWSDLINNSSTFWGELEFIPDGKIVDDSAVASIVKKALGIMRIEPDPDFRYRSYGTKPDRYPAIFISLECLFSRYSEIGRGNSSCLYSFKAKLLSTKQSPAERGAEGREEVYRIASEYISNHYPVKACIDWRMNRISPAAFLDLGEEDRYLHEGLWELLRGVRMLHLPLDTMATFLYTAVEKGGKKLSVELLQFSDQSGSSLNIESKELEFGQLFDSLKVLIINDTKNEELGSPRPRHKISQNLLAQLLQSTPRLEALVLCDFYVPSNNSGKPETPRALDLLSHDDIEYVDFSGTKFASGFPLLNKSCKSVRLRRSRLSAAFFYEALKAPDALPDLQLLDLSDSPDITDAMLLGYLYHKRALPKTFQLRNCSGLEFSSTLLQQLASHCLVIDVSQNKAFTDKALYALFFWSNISLKNIDICGTSVTEGVGKLFMMRPDASVHVNWSRNGEVRAEERWVKKMDKRETQSYYARDEKKMSKYTNLLCADPFFSIERLDYWWRIAGYTG
ncbi:hypothetical protein BZA70DRAFT_153318 [Myxozyma melibiosi]|uniref:F-box domain-containing protein n=1 Tax=Myxozyma melibiosi TaxID=54550 RepID=A0ABR1F665_9ASCO